MKRIAWVIAAIALVAFVASFSELQRMRKRFGEVTRNAVHIHSDVRQAVIRFQLAQTDAPIVIIGDSITEMARFPGSIAGKAVVNAGIGGATYSSYAAIAPKILEGFKPSLIVVAIGANDVKSATREADLSDLLSILKPYAPLLVVGLPSGPTSDGIHPTPATSRQWVGDVVNHINAVVR